MFGLLLVPSASLWACGLEAVTVAESMDCCHLMHSACSNQGARHLDDPCCQHHPQQARAVLAVPASFVPLIPSLRVLAPVVTPVVGLRCHDGVRFETAPAGSSPPLYRLHSVLLV